MRRTETRPERSLSLVVRLFLPLFGLLLMQVLSAPVVYSDLDFSREQICVHPETIDSAQAGWQDLELRVVETQSSVRNWCAGLAAATPSYRIVSVKQTTVLAGMIWPVAGSLSSGYGSRRHPVTRRHHFHAAIDIRARVGTPVSAPCEGRVVAVQRAGAMGRMVKMITASGLTLSFGHLSGYRCRPGQWLRRGQILGLVGATGRATGPHLHFAMQKDGRYVNPLTFLAPRTEYQNRYLP